MTDPATPSAVPSSPSTSVSDVPLTSMDIRGILDVLPHRSPFVLIDRVVAITPGERAVGIKCVSFGDPWFPGHFPGHPVMPGVLILEAMAQVGGILAFATDRAAVTDSLFYFLGIDEAKFRKPVTPGDRLELELTVLKRKTKVWKFRGEAKVDGALVAEAELLASVVPKPV
ncbi:MAG: 3-hydroxyacyl-ACP dehydratase FabZ [Polyangiaceae bacterium]